MGNACGIPEDMNSEDSSVMVNPNNNKSNRSSGRTKKKREKIVNECEKDFEEYNGK